MRIFLYLIIMPILFLLAFLAAISFAQPQPPFTDQRDGKSYRAVKIGEQVWMAENLNYAVEGSKCYDNKPENCAKYGRLYYWGMAKVVCPKGWHLPDNKEWDKLYRFSDLTTGTESYYPTESPFASETAGKYLKATSGWENGLNKFGNGKDKFGFAALPGGFCSASDTFYDIGKLGIWWSANEFYASNACIRAIYYNVDVAYEFYRLKTFFFSVRYVRD